jgi:hypothetical protein
VQFAELTKVWVVFATVGLTGTNRIPYRQAILAAMPVAALSPRKTEKIGLLEAQSTEISPRLGMPQRAIGQHKKARPTWLS